MLTINLIQQITDIVFKNHLEFIGKELGLGFLTNIGKELLGPDVLKGLYQKNNDTILLNYHLGKLCSFLPEEKLKLLTREDLVKYVNKGKILPLTKEDLSEINRLKQQVYISLNNLNTQISSDITQIILNKLNTKIGSDTEKVVLSKEEIKEVVDDMVKHIEKWDARYLRILNYNSTSSFERAKINQLLQNKNQKVYKQVNKVACKHCKRLYLTRSLQPKVFDIRVLINNGSNIGRKTEDWLPTVDPIHPNCRCNLKAVPEGKRYNPETDSFDLPVPGFKTKKKPKRTKLMITVAGEPYYF